MCVENLGAGIQKTILAMYSSHFCVKSRSTLSTFHIFDAFFTFPGKM